MPIKKKYFLIVILIFLLLNLALFKNTIFNHDRLLSPGSSSETFRYFNISKFLEGQSLRQGLILWNSYLFCGTPWIANPQNQFFYPLNFPFTFLPFHLAINYSFLLHIFLIGMATFLLVSYLGLSWYVAMISGLIAMFNGLVFLRCFAGHLLTINTFFWLPLIFLFLEMCLRNKRSVYAVFAGLCLGSQILAGNSQYAYYTLLAIFFYFIFCIIRDFFIRKKQLEVKFFFFSLFIFLAVGIGVASLRLLPILEFTRLSDRAVLSYDFVASWSFPPQNLITYLLPEFFGDIIHAPYWGEHNFWEMCGYVGILPLILSLIAVFYKRNKYTVFFACLGLFALVASLGDYTPLLRFFYDYLPGFNKFRGHSKFLALFVFSVGILSAYGLSWLLEKQNKLRKDYKRVLLPLGILAGVITILCFFLFFNQSRGLLSWAQIWESKNWAGMVAESTFAHALFSLIKFNALVVSIFALFFFWLRNRISSRAFKIFIFVIIIADLWLFGAKYIASESVNKCYWDRGVVGFLKEHEKEQPYRVLSHLLPDELFANNAVFDGISVINGYEALLLGRYDNFLKLCSSYRSFDSPAALKLFNLANLKYIILPKWKKLDHPNLNPVYEDESLRVWENAGCLPRAYIVHSAKLIKDKMPLRSLLEDDFEPTEAVILEQGSSIEANMQGLSQRSDEEVNFLKYSHNQVIIQAKLQEQGYLILGDVNYPGWQAKVLNTTTGEKKDVAIFYANYIFRGILLKKGNYIVRFSFRPVSFYIGSAITILTIIIVLISLICIYRGKNYRRVRK